jgi:hypothetical protein
MSGAAGGKSKSADKRPASSARPASARLQPKLKVGEPNDPLEHEADAVAQRVTSGQPAAVSRMPAASEKKADAVHRATAPDQKPDTVHRASAQASDSSMSSAAQQAVDSKGAGRPLDSSVRSRIESSTGADLSHVRVHDDPAAHSSARALNARAFTHGSDIWMGPGESTSDVRLMAHEATHVLQQRGDAAHRMVQRAAPAAAPAAGGTTTAPAAAPVATPDPSTLPLAAGRPDPAAMTITFDELHIPPFKMAAHRGSLYNAHQPLKRKRNFERGNPGQRDRWRTNISTARAETMLAERIRRATRAQHVDPNATHVVEVPTRGHTQPFLFGPIPTIARALTIPNWAHAGTHPPLAFYDVDHIVELQVANWNEETWANELDNMELLDSAINQESGRAIRGNIEAKVQSFLHATGSTYGTSVADVKERYQLIFQTPVAGGRGARSAGRDKYWTRTEIEAGDHLRPVRASSVAALGGHGTVRVFPTETGGLGKRFHWPADRVSSEERDWLRPFVITRKHFITEGENVEASTTFGSLFVNIPASHKDWQPLGQDAEIQVTRVPGARYAGWVQKASVLMQMHALRKKGLSPIRVDTFELRPDGIFLRGAVLPELPLLHGADIGFELTRGHLTLYKEFTAGSLRVPPPFSITTSSLRIFADTRRGLGADGRIDFEIQRVGQGFIAAEVSTSGPIGFAGGFDFDSTTFNPAHIDLRYDGAWHGHGTIGVPDGKVAGVKRAHLDITVDGTTISGAGEVEPKIRAIQKGAISFVHSDTGGSAITGSLQLSDDIPNVQGGSVEATLSKPPAQDAWDFSARGTVTAGVAGFTATVNADYRHGLFTVQGEGAFARGMMSGTVTVGATNRAIGPDGQPTDTIGDHVIAYGGGTVTVRLTPWLQGTVGVRFLPNGELELTGTIALPSTVDLFPEKTFNRNIFSIDIDIPIVGFSVAGHRVGIFATIGGGLDLNAGIGPGQLRDLGVSITYNPAHEDQTHITGGARLVIPAHAGLRLNIHGALGAGIPIVDAELGLEVGGALGLQGAAEASVNVDWTPATGLVLDALGEIYVQPKFRFDLTGFLKVEADLFVTTIHLYEKRWELAAIELGPNLRFGVRFPIHYQEGQPFDISLDDLQFEIPHVDTHALLMDLVHQIV